MRLEKFTRVSTPHGSGVIVGYDLPDSEVWRYKVVLDSRRQFCGYAPCYFPKDVSNINDPTTRLITSGSQATLRPKGDIPDGNV